MLLMWDHTSLLRPPLLQNNQSIDKSGNWKPCDVKYYFKPGPISQFRIPNSISEIHMPWRGKGQSKQKGFSSSSMASYGEDLCRQWLLRPGVPVPYFGFDIQFTSITFRLEKTWAILVLKMCQRYGHVAWPSQATAEPLPRKFARPPQEKGTKHQRGTYLN